jgi:hypothetical protein
LVSWRLTAISIVECEAILFIEIKTLSANEKNCSGGFYYLGWSYTLQKVNANLIYFVFDKKLSL